MTDLKDLYEYKFEPDNFEFIGSSPLDEIIPENPGIVESLESFNQQYIYLKFFIL